MCYNNGLVEELDLGENVNIYKNNYNSRILV